MPPTPTKATPDPNSLDRITSAFFVGTETLGDQVCEHYAMRQQAIDWQIWLRRGDQALPCKFVITTTDDPSMPQYTALVTWKTSETFDDSTFTFAPEQDARRIEIHELRPAPAETEGSQ